MSLVFDILEISSKQISFCCCVYQNVSAVNFLPTLSFAYVKMQETQRTENSSSCHKPHDYYKR